MEGIKTIDDFINTVRHFMRDYPHLNRLSEDIETSDRTIRLLTYLAIDEFNTLILPETNYTFDNFPSYSLLLYKVVAEILLTVSLLQARNQLTYSAGGISISFSDKAQVYMAFRQQLENMWQMYAHGLKIKQNIENALDVSGVPSEYAIMRSYWLGVQYL